MKTKLTPVLAACLAGVVVTATYASAERHELEGGCVNKNQAEWRGWIDSGKDVARGRVTAGGVTFDISSAMVGDELAVSVEFGGATVAEFRGARDGDDVRGVYRTAVGLEGAMTLCWNLRGPDGAIWTASETAARWDELKQMTEEPENNE